MKNVIELKIPKLFAGDSIPIVFTADHHFSVYLSVAIQSIIENAFPGHCYDVVILHRDIAECRINKILGMASELGSFSVRFYNIEAYANKYRIFKKGNLAVEKYDRFLIPELFSEYEKVLYLDSDVIFLTDAWEITQTETGGAILASMEEVCRGLYSEEENQNLLKFLYKGFIVFNVKKFLEVYPAEKLWQFLWDTKKEFINRDQDEPKEWHEVYRLPGVIHYARNEKPWLVYEGAFYNEFWYYAFKTPYYQELLLKSSSQDLENMFYKKRLKLTKCIKIIMYLLQMEIQACLSRLRKIFFVG